MRRRSLIALGAALGLVLMAQGLIAGQVGPLSDYSGNVGANPGTSDFTIIINTQFWRIRDQIIIDIPSRSSAMAVGGVGYASSSTNGSLDVTTIYGVNVGTPGGPPQLAGFDAASPHPSFGPENILGSTGTAYQSSAPGLVPVSALPTLFPDIVNFSPFSSTDPGMVYAFRTSGVPAADVAGVPLPSALPVGLAMGGLGIFARFWQRRRAAAA